MELVIYCDEDGSAPFLEWFRGLADKAQDNCRVRIEQLRDRGHFLRRPEAAYLRDDVYELRVKAERVHSGEINRAIKRKQAFAADPGQHTYTLRDRL